MNKYTPEEYQKGYADGRAEVIDEIMKIVGSYDDRGLYLGDVKRITDGIKGQIEKLKEKENDSQNGNGS